MNKVKEILAHALLVLFMLHHISCSYFYHTHTYSWGTVVHSHLYSFGEDGEEPVHSHSTNQLEFIQLINTTTFTAITSVIAPLFVALLLAVFVVQVVTRCHTLHHSTLSGRAPPAFC